jgi:hypothetical protein
MSESSLQMFGDEYHLQTAGCDRLHGALIGLSPDEP